jgi:hypothetical protein
LVFPGISLAKNVYILGANIKHREAGTKCKTPEKRKKKTSDTGELSDR